MGEERALMAVIMLALAVACVYGAYRALRGPATTAGQGLAGAAAILAALMFGGWAFNLIGV